MLENEWIEEIIAKQDKIETLDDLSKLTDELAEDNIEIFHTLFNTYKWSFDISDIAFVLDKSFHDWIWTIAKAKEEEPD